MPNDVDDDVERITRPLAKVIRDVGAAVADGQQRLDKQLRAQYLAAAEDGPIELETPWYRFAEVEVDLELHFYTHEVVEQPTPEVEAAIDDAEGVPPGAMRYDLEAAVATPSDVTFSERDHGGTSRMHFRIVPVTPPSSLQRERTEESARTTNGTGKREENGNRTGGSRD